MDAVGREVRHAARRLVRSPAFTLAAVLTLALAIGANTAIFTVVYRVVLNPLPYPDSDRLIALDYGLPTRNVNSGVKYMSWEFYYQLADRARTLDKVAVYNISGVTLTGTGGNPERIQISRATPSLASVLRVSQPWAGGLPTRKACRAARRLSCSRMGCGSAATDGIPPSSADRSPSTDGQRPSSA